MNTTLKNIGIILMGLGIAGFFLGDFDLSVPSELGAFYIVMGLLVIGLIALIISYIQSKNLLRT